MSAVPPDSATQSIYAERHARLTEKLRLLCQTYDLETRVEEKLRLQYLIESVQQELAEYGNNPKDRSWVWASTDESIEKGQISVLSVVETFLAVGLYIWLAFHFERQWWLLITAVAAPIILLRSEDSKVLGLKWLSYYKQDVSWSEFSIIKRIILIFSPLTLASLIFIPLIYDKLFFIKIWLWLFLLLMFLASTLIFCFFMIYMFEEKLSGLAYQGLIGNLLLIMITPFFALGIWLRSLCIRFFATLCYPIEGIKSLGKNWYSNLWVVDLLHPPELMPDAAKVDETFTIKGLLKRLDINKKGIYFSSLVIILIWYPPALMWRWSLKATLWLWWPLALLLKPPFKNKVLAEIDEIADIVSLRIARNKWLAFVALLVSSWLVLSYFPHFKDWVDTLGDTISKPLTKLLEITPPPFGLRQLALWLCCIASGVLWLYATKVQLWHTQILAEADNLQDFPKARLEKFIQRAKILERIYTFVVVSFIILGYSIILYLAQTHYPEYAKHFIPVWLVPYL